MPLKLLQHKSWHVWSRSFDERVRLAEEEDEEKSLVRSGVDDGADDARAQRLSLLRTRASASACASTASRASALDSGAASTVDPSGFVADSTPLAIDSREYTNFCRKRVRAGTRDRSRETESSKLGQLLIRQQPLASRSTHEAQPVANGFTTNSQVRPSSGEAAERELYKKRAISVKNHNPRSQIPDFEPWYGRDPSTITLTPCGERTEQLAEDPAMLFLRQSDSRMPASNFDRGKRSTLHSQTTDEKPMDEALAELRCRRLAREHREQTRVKGIVKRPRNR